MYEGFAFLQNLCDTPVRRRIVDIPLIFKMQPDYYLFVSNSLLILKQKWIIIPPFYWPT